MQVIPRCRKLLIIRNYMNFSTTQFAEFHSTPFYCDKWKNNWKSDSKGGQQPSKNNAKFSTRQKRADTKRALKSLLSHYGDRGSTFENDEPWKAPAKSCETDFSKKRRSKPEFQRAEKIHNHRMRRKFRKESCAEDDHDPDTVFQANFGGRWYTWSFDSWNGSSRRSSPRFDWRDTFRGTSGGQEEHGRPNEHDSEDEEFYVGLPKDRAVLGLSPKGPLKMKDVKQAFHSSALKWHPDKHEGPTQAAAAEKFKLCLNAYNSLCSALSGA